MTRFRFASAPINWGIESANDPDNPKPDVVLRAIADAGYDGVELGPFGYFGDSTTEIAKRLEETGLEAVAMWTNIPLDEALSSHTLENLILTFRHLSELGVDHLIVSDLITPERMEIVGRVGQFPERWWTEQDWDQVSGTLGQISTQGEAHGVEIAVHPHVGGHIETGDEFVNLIKAIEGMSINLCIDTGHLIIGGAEPIGILEAHAHRVTHLHAKDVDAALLSRLQAGTIHYREAVGQGLYCDLGDGIIDWRGYRSALIDSDYSGWVVAEQDRLLSPGDQAPFDSNAKNLTFLEHLLLSN